jgi:hypothetical protein
MSHFKEEPHFSGLQLVAVTNSVLRPQDTFPFRRMVGVDQDGQTVRIFDSAVKRHNFPTILTF